MMNKLRLLTGATLVLALGSSPACNNKNEEDDSGDGTTTSDDGMTSTGPGMTSMNTTMQADSGDSGPVTTEATSVDPTTGNPCPMEGALGEACMDPMCDCASGNCFVVGPLGGVCSECDEDADCAKTTGFGCNFGNPLEGTPAVCSTSGDIGESCETADACAMGLYCPTLIEVPGILSAATCSECDPDMGGCMGAQICAPVYDIAAIGGYYQCVDPGSIPDNEGCNLTGDGSECMSGECAPAAIMGIPVVGVCSPCNEDADCPGMGMCVLPEVAIDGNTLVLVPGMCM